MIFAISSPILFRGPSNDLACNRLRNFQSFSQGRFGAHPSDGARFIRVQRARERIELGGEAVFRYECGTPQRRARMPELKDQLAIPQSVTADFVIGRARRAGLTSRP